MRSIDALWLERDTRRPHCTLNLQAPVYDSRLLGTSAPDEPTSKISLRARYMDRNSIGDRYDLGGRISRGWLRCTWRPIACSDVRLPSRCSTEPLLTTLPSSSDSTGGPSRGHPQPPQRVPIYDWGTVDGTYYIVIGCVPGMNLKEALRWNGPLTEAEALRIGAKVAAVLEEAHRHGTIHRDIKPHNILLDQSGHVVTDFGIARRRLVAAHGKQRHPWDRRVRGAGAGAARAD